jgi:hypothetical protein
MAADAPNMTLSQLLAGVSWSGERLVREICRVLGWPTTVPALVSSRLAYGYALIGDAERFHAVHGRACELVDHRPRWAIGSARRAWTMSAASNRSAWE